MNLMDIMLKTNTIRKEKPKMEKELIQALINHLTADAEKLGKIKIPVEDPQAFSVLTSVMRDIRACAITIQQELEAEAEKSKEPEPETPAEKESDEDAHEATESEEKEA